MHSQGPAEGSAADREAIAGLRTLGIADDAIKRAVECGDPEGAIFEAVLLPSLAERTVSPADIEHRGGL